MKPWLEGNGIEIYSTHNIVIKYNHTYDSTIKMKYVDVKSST